MSGVAIVGHLLATSSELTAVVPEGRIMSGVLPLDTELPAISITQISGTPHNTSAMNQTKYYIDDRVQVAVLAKTYHEVKAILALVRAACPQTRGLVNGFQCEAVIPDTEGPDLYDYEALIHQQSQDYMVSFIR